MALSIHIQGVSGEELFIDKQEDGGASFTVIRREDGKDIQMDFDTLSGDDVRDLIEFLKPVRQAAGDPQ